MTRRDRDRMLMDSRLLPPDSRLSADVVVVGAGPIGIALAQEFAAAGLDVIQLESGGESHDPAADALSEPAEFDFGPLGTLGHARQIGGNAHVWTVRTGASNWGVRLIPLNSVDFEGRADDAGSAWPFSLADLAPQFARALQFFGLPGGLETYDAEHWTRNERDTLFYDPEVSTEVFQFADGQAVVRRGIEDIGSSTSIRLVHNATVVEVLTNADASAATGVRAISVPGREFIVTAAHVVLAAGAVSSTQLLLASDAVHPEGLGNKEDLVGRYFMDHPLVRGGEVWPSATGDFTRRDFYDLRLVDAVPIMGHLQLTDGAIREQDLNNLSALFFPREDVAKVTYSRRQKAGILAAINVRRSLELRKLPKAHDVGVLIAGLDGIGRKWWDSVRYPKAHLERGGWSLESVARKNSYDYWEVVHQAEQRPHWDNRITLSDDRDQLGSRRTAVTNVMHAEDLAGIRRSQEVFARALARNGWGEFRIMEADGQPVLRTRTSHHFMGTTRMNASPELGVVDAYGRVHGIPNLVVASSSVFPSGGFANVTLTGLAVALRSADSVLEEVRSLKPSTVQGG